MIRIHTKFVQLDFRWLIDEQVFWREENETLWRPCTVSSYSYLIDTTTVINKKGFNIQEFRRVGDYYVFKKRLNDKRTDLVDEFERYNVDFQKVLETFKSVLNVNDK